MSFRLPSALNRCAFAMLFCLAIFCCPEISVAKDAAKSDSRANPERLERGGKVYRTQCANCHGKQGQGSKDHYSDPLIGDASIAELAEIISETMPEEDPEQCVGDDALAVAKYIHKTFYSEQAQLRSSRPQTKFSRLTGSQLQQSLADLYQHFFGSPHRVDERGLSGAYFNAGRWDKKKLKVERIDPVVDFDFGREPPVEGVEAKEFYINWTGSLLVQHTGRYELVIESTCSMKFRFGHHDHVLINNHVQSAGKTEFRRTLNLIGGRQYPIQIDFTQRKRKTEQPPAKFSMRWVPPGGTEVVIPTEYLLPKMLPSTFALQAKLPPDDRSYGYDRGTRVDRQWDDAVTAAALEFGTVAARDLWPHYKRRHRKDSDENRGRLRGFLTELAEVAFHVPLDDETRKLYVDDQLAAAEDDQLAIARTCLMLIKSPRFLYPTLGENSSPSHRVANQLTLVMFDSLPSDSWLIDQAKRDHFTQDPRNSENRIRQAANRLANDPRLHGKMMEMFFDWLDIDPSAEISKDPESFDGFNIELVLDLRRSLERSLSDVFWSDESDYRQLFTRDWNWTNQRLGAFYGDGWVAEPNADTIELVKSKPAPGRSLGILTHPLVMSHLSYYDTTSPIHRGVFLIRRVLGRTLRPPNEAFTPLNPNLHPELTTRQRVELQTGSDKCQVCHQRINALGFPLENYDAVGRYRDTEHSKPIDPSGGYVARDGTEYSFASAAELAQFLAENESAHRAFIEKAFEHFAKQPLAAFGDEAQEDLLTRFRESGFHMRQLIVEIAVLVATHDLKMDGRNEST